ncbi:hypothetical protein X758_12600 [Mesorhizobium sp. LSHC416B00]|nr:hypothetical protein X758_12600 [Mesorhizobium sp. LSHC416B00]
MAGCSKRWSIAAALNAANATAGLQLPSLASFRRVLFRSLRLGRLQQALVDSGGLERRKCYGRTAASILGLRN